MPLAQFFKKNSAFFIPVIIALITGILFLLVYPKGTIHLVMNSWYHPGLDPFFKYVTWLGDGLAYAFFIPLMAIIRWRLFLGLLFTGIITLLLTGFLKQVVFDDAPRPASYFENKAQLRFVEGVEVHKQHSFPSGHTTAAFACYGFFALIVRRQLLKFSFFLLAFAVGYSRIYLSQHFLADVVAGAFIGALIACSGYYLMEWLNWPHEKARLGLRKSNSTTDQSA